MASCKFCSIDLGKWLLKRVDEARHILYFTGRSQSQGFGTAEYALHRIEFPGRTFRLGMCR